MKKSIAALSAVAGAVAGIVAAIPFVMMIGAMFGYVGGFLFGWIFPESWAAVHAWLGMPVSLTPGMLGAFVCAFFQSPRIAKS